VVRPFKFLCLGLFALLALAPASADAIPKYSAYRVSQARFDVQETQKYTSTYKASWAGDGHQHETQQAEDPELPALPLPIAASGGTVQVHTDRLRDGDETLIDAEGKKEDCSGVWEEEEDGVFSVRIKPKGQGKVQASWEIPTGISSRSCGSQYDLMPSPLIVKSTVNGEIGGRRLVLETSGKETKTRSTSVGSETQTVKWKATVVLTLVTPPKLPQPPKLPKPPHL
jgi:hypothetical protein